MNINEKIEQFDKKFNVMYAPSGQSFEAEPEPEAIKNFLRTFAEEIINELIPEEIHFDWKPQSDDESDKDVILCSICRHFKDDPECPHICEFENEFRQKLIVKSQAILGERKV